MGSQLRVGEVLRSARNRDPSLPLIDGYPNIHHLTASEVLAQVQLSKGINPMAKVRASGERRRPAILICSSSWESGTAETPWRDVFDLDNGRVRYFGDHSGDDTVPVGTMPGNAVLLEAFAGHQASTAQQRAMAVPLLVFAEVSRNTIPEEHVEFCGVAVIERVERIEQEAEGRTSLNYRYDLAVLDLSAEREQVDWAWIEARGNPEIAAAEALERAPSSWRQWVEHGDVMLPMVRRRIVRPAESEDFDSQSAGGEQESERLLPAPRLPEDAASVSSAGDGASETLTPSELIDRLKSLKIHQRKGQQSRHKPLALLWGIARVAAGKERLALWRQFRDEVGGLMAEFGHPESSITPEYPFWHLRTSGLWDVRGVPSEQAGKPHAAAFDRANPEGGMTEQAALLLRDPFVRSQAIAVIRETYLADIGQHALMERLGLAGYESASGVGECAEDEETYRGPAERRTITSSRVARDIELAKKVKKLHDDRCQVCGLQLSTGFGTYSEAAHIRGLGRPHDGPDELPNLLVLCPNHHVQFDTLAIYVDAEGTVRSTADGSRRGELRRLPAHPIAEAHLRYQRALCGRDATE
ncbi:HNH endonuclease [Streptomyces sp. NPDC050161]|uniref:HNH endonuclease n=1 Tax=Streptomyces sp. NPDC050161 TaxID=3365604 RepID=UPI0037A58E83